MSQLKQAVKQTLFCGLYCLAGILPRKIPVIVYHSVDESGSCISITPERFRQQMELINRMGYRTITASKLVDALQKKQPQELEKTVVLTFDDGFESNYKVAFPVLKDFGLTATIFLTTGFLGRRCTWDKKEDIPELPLLSWEMVREMSAYGIDFQAHTVTHPHLPQLSEDKIRKELTDCRRMIEDELGKPCDILCYPYGEFDSRLVQLLPELGFRAAFAGFPEQESIYTISRVGSAHLSTPLAFRAALRGSFHLYYSLKKGLRRYKRR